MTRTIWLASYPKSGNTWLRILFANLSAQGDRPIDINELPEVGAIASARAPFDRLLLIESGLLSHDEADVLRPRVYEELARSVPDAAAPATDARGSVRLAKVHDAYTLTVAGEPLLSGSRGADGAIVIVRDPRDVAPSLANHNCTGIDDAIAFMNNSKAGFCLQPNRQHGQLRQRLLGWSGHVASWLDQRDIPVCLVRYEDMAADAAAALTRAIAFAGREATAEQVARAVALCGFAELQRQETESGFREGPRRAGDGRFFRRGVAGGWRDELTARQIGRIEAAHGPMMSRLGYALTAIPHSDSQAERTA